MKRGIVSVLGLTTLAMFTGCDSPRHERRVVISEPAPVVRERVRAPVIVTQAPPAPVREVVPASPGPRYVWAPGYWVWSGNDWQWQGGHWTIPPRERAVWVPGHWVERRGEWVWEPGQWR